jgi:hypothetical protein
MAKNEKSYERSPEVRYRIMGDKAVVLRQDIAEVLLLNEVGARVLDLMDGDRTMDDIRHVILSEYEVDQAQLEQDLRRFVEELQRAGIVQPSEKR